MQRRLLVLMILFFLMLFLPLNARVVNAQFTEAGVQKLRVSVEAPDFTVKEIEGGKVHLKEMRGKIILLNFFATW